MIILLILFTLYYIFILISSVFAMHHINKNKKHNEYKFNKPAIVFLMIFIVIPAFFPLILGITEIISNILGMIIYLVIGVPSTNSIILMGKLFNSPDSLGGNKIYDRKSILIFIFYLFNIFFGHLIFFMERRRKRANCVIALSIIFCIYNFVKICGIIMNILFSQNYDNKINDNNLIESIKNYNQSVLDDIKLQKKNKPIKKPINNNINYNINYNNNYNNNNYNNNYHNNSNINNNYYDYNNNKINNDYISNNDSKSLINNNIENYKEDTTRDIIKDKNYEKNKYLNNDDKETNKYKLKNYLGYERPFPNQIPENDRKIKTEVQSTNNNNDLSNNNFDKNTDINKNKNSKFFNSDKSSKNIFSENLNEPHIKNKNKNDEEEFNYDN